MCFGHKRQWERYKFTHGGVLRQEDESVNPHQTEAVADAAQEKGAVSC